jgi:peptide/nickel transport system substrate-binding protein
MDLRRDDGSIARRRLARRRLLQTASLAGLGIAAAGLLGCGPRSRTGSSAGTAGTGTGQPKQGGKVALNVGTDPFDWDLSYVGKSIPNGNGQALAYESLLGFKYGANVKYGDLQVVPELAQKWEDPDAQTFTFHLRPGVKFANLPPVNGRELTSADVKWTYEYWSRTGSMAGKNLPQAQFAWFFEGMDSIQTPDAQTVVIRFKEPFAPFLSYAAAEYNPIVPHEIFDQYGNLHDHIVGTGPWQLDPTASQKGSKWVWKRNPIYWDSGKPYIDEVDWLVLPDAATAVSAFTAKQLDWIGSPATTPQSAIDIKRMNPGATEYKYSASAPMHLYMNNRAAPLNDVRVRQAVSYAIDRDEIIKTIDLGDGNWALAGSLPDTFSQEEVRQILKYDPQKAKQLLSDAGFANGVDLEFIYPGTAYGNGYISEMQLLQAQLKKVGINLNLKSIDKDSYSSNKKTGKYTITMTGKDIEGDVDSYLFATFHSASKDNYAGVKDPKLDAMLEAQRREADPAKRRELVREAVKYVNAEQAYGLALETGSGYEFSQPSLKGYAVQFSVRQTPEAESWLDK